MKRHPLFLSITCIVILCASGFANAQAPPTPLRNVTIQARVTLDGEGRYNYFYTVTNPSSNTLGISEVAIDIATPPEGAELPTHLGSLPPGHKKPYPDQFQLAKRERLRVIPFYLLSVPGWDSCGLTFEHGIGITLLGSRLAADWSRWRESVPPLPPGGTLGELQLTSYGLPGIRNIVARPRIGDLNLPPDWSTSESDTDEQIEEKTLKEESLGCLVRTIGATAPPAGFIPVQFNQRLLDYLNESVTLQWVRDPNLAQQLRALLIQNDLALREERYADSQPLLLQFMQLVRGGTGAQRTAEAEGLLYHNAQHLYAQIIDTIPIAVEISPHAAKRPLNETHEIQVRVTQGIQPRQGYALYAMVVAGPHRGLSWQGRSDAQGRWGFGYRGERVGTDKIALLCTLAQANEENYCFIKNSAPVYVTWKGGPDLMLNDLFPPVMQIPFGLNAIPLRESTVNVGTVGAPPSKTRHYLSRNQYWDESALVLGERNVPALNVNEMSEYQASIPVPQNLDPGLYLFFSCADADKQIAELDEQNNCKTQVPQVFGIVRQLENYPPDCTQAKASPESLWPPNHKYRGISIKGVTDPDRNRIAITATAIRQSEPVNGLGDGDTSPDGTLSPLMVRAERSDTGTGRVYAIEFTAADGKGGTCRGTVSVCVPHDQGKDKGCTGGATPYDSTLP